MTWVRLGLIHDYMQADALKARLHSEGIEARVIAQTHTGSTAGEPALRLGGVSAVSSGHPILVQEADLERAREVAIDFQNSNRLSDLSHDVEDDEPRSLQRDYRRRFLLLGVAGSLFIPFIGAPIALYHFVQYLRHGGPLLKWDILLALAFTLIGLFTWGIGYNLWPNLWN